MDKLTLLVDVRILSDKIKQLEADIEEYKSVIDSYKDKLDVSQCLYEDEKAENQRLRAEIEEFKKRKRVIICVYCETAIPYFLGSNRADVIRIMKEHDKECKKNPLVEENQRLTKAIEFVENRAQLLIGVLEEDGERSYTGFVKEIKNRAQKALKGE